MLASDDGGGDARYDYARMAMLPLCYKSDDVALYAHMRVMLRHDMRRAI